MAVKQPVCMDCGAPVEPGYYAHCRLHRLQGMLLFSKHSESNAVQTAMLRARKNRLQRDSRGRRKEHFREYQRNLMRNLRSDPIRKREEQRQQRKRYKNNPEYREKLLARQRARSQWRYKHDSEYRERKLLRARNWQRARAARKKA